MARDQVGKYKILGLLGQGAMGEVHKAFDPVLHRQVAIKTITPNLVLDDTFKQRFQREAQSAALLSHPNIVTVYELGEDEGVVYLVMELLRGTDLKTLIACANPLSLDEKLRIVEQVLDGLAFAHGKDVVHRDLKPANVHVQRDLTTKIMDFGLARLGASDLTRTGAILGTPNYMSPEQVRAEPADARSDLFAVGAVLYELISGRRAFAGDTVHATLFEVLERHPQPLRSLVPGLPPPVAVVTERALRKDPAERFSSAGEMKQAIAQARRAVGPDTSITVASTIGDSEAPTIGGAGSGGRTTVVDGSAALAPRAGDPSVTVHPEPTLVEASPPTVTGHRPIGRLRWIAIAFVGVALAAAALFRIGSGPPQAPSPADLGQIEDAWVASRLALAQMSLESREFADAVSEAERVLARHPDRAEAREIVEEGRSVLAELQAQARQARDAFRTGDRVRASEALKQVLAIDPRDPVVAEVGPTLDQYFRGQAENARRVASRAQRAAEGAGLKAAALAAAAELTRTAESLFTEGRFAQATQRFLEAGDAFARARRESQSASAVSTVPLSEPSTLASSTAASAPSPVTTLPPATVAFGTAPAPSPAPVPDTAPAPARSSPPAAAPPPASLSAAQAVREALADYGRALETRDLGLFKSVMPGLSRDRERQVRESFRDVRSLSVALVVQSVEVNGTEAVAQVTRRDVLEGKPQPPLQLRVRFVQRDGVWTIAQIE
ncbi:MAG TPA: serine/threonine-protein kinase [Vicinamibacteria bacterium]|jgi:serine/threonine-protein kinase